MNRHIFKQLLTALSLAALISTHQSYASVEPMFSIVHEPADKPRNQPIGFPRNQPTQIEWELYINGSAELLKIENINEIQSNPNSPNLSESDTEAATDAISQIVEELLNTSAEASLEPLTQEPAAEQNTELGTEDLQDLVNLSNATNWLATELIDSAPEKAADAIIVSTTAARNAYQVNGLMGQITGSSLESQSMKTLAQVIPKMSPSQRRAFIQKIKQLPPAVPLADTLQGETELISELQVKIENAVTAHKQEYPSSNTIFPENLRLASILQLPNSPTSISIHNLNTLETFWIEEGQERRGISLDVVNTNTKTATIREGQRSATINLQSSAIADRHVPWAVILGIMNIDINTLDPIQLEKEQAELIDLGLTPDTLLNTLDSQQTFYTNLLKDIEQSDRPAHSLLEQHLAGLSDDSAFGINVIPSVSRKANELVLEQRAMDVGLHYLEAIEANSPSSNQIDYSGDTYQIEVTENGFSVSQVAPTSGQAEHWPILEFGEAPK